MHAQQLTITNTVNAIINIKKAIEPLIKNVSNDIEFNQVKSIYLDAMCYIENALSNVNRMTVNPGVISYLERCVETLSIESDWEVTQQKVEDTNDDVIGFLNAAMSCLGYCRNAV